MVLPMYMRSDAMQEKEREEQERLFHWVKHIRKAFTGDERFMILQEYYRQNHYHPLYVLRGSLSSANISQNNRLMSIYRRTVSYSLANMGKM